MNLEKAHEFEKKIVIKNLKKIHEILYNKKDKYKTK